MCDLFKAYDAGHDDGENKMRQKIAPVLAQLRHAYLNLVCGHVRAENHKKFADGLIAPAIRKLEQL